MKESDGAHRASVAFAGVSHAGAACAAALLCALLVMLLFCFSFLPGAPAASQEEARLSAALVALRSLRAKHRSDEKHGHQVARLEVWRTCCRCLLGIRESQVVSLGPWGPCARCFKFHHLDLTFTAHLRQHGAKATESAPRKWRRHLEQLLSFGASAVDPRKGQPRQLSFVGASYRGWMMGMRNVVRMGMRTMMRTTTARIRGEAGESLSRTLGARNVFRTSVLKHEDGLSWWAGYGANHMMPYDRA